MAMLKDKGVIEFDTSGYEWTQPSGVSLKTPSPWGDVFSYARMATGIDDVATTGGDCIKLSPERNEAMPDRFRREDGWYSYGNYDSALPRFVFFDDIRHYLLYSDGSDGLPISRADIEQVVKDNFPYDYEVVTGEAIPEGESFVKDQARFFHEHKNDLIVYSTAVNDDGVTIRVSACRGGRHKGRSSVVTYAYDLPLDVYYEYDANSDFGIVIDEEQYSPIAISGCTRIESVK
jgi:hypothetical protein